MAAAAFDRRCLAFLVDLFITVFTEFMGCFFVTVNIGIADIFCMAAVAFINCHNLFFGMMAGCTCKHILMIPVRKCCRFSRSLSLQGNVCRADIYFHGNGAAGTLYVDDIRLYGAAQ